MVENYDEIESTFAQIPGANTRFLDLEGGYAEITVSEKQAGPLFRELRTNGFDFEAKRLGNRIVAHVPAEQESEGLGKLFG